jgi:multiple sugar transport system substrate-binding protein
MLLGCTLLVSVIAGCGGTHGQADNSSSEKQSQEVQTPVTLTVLPQPGDVSLFQQLYVEPVKAKYPNITLQMVELPKGQSIETLVANGNIPDIVGIWNGQVGQLKQLELTEDLTPYVKRDHIDLNAFQPNLIDAVQDNGKLLGLPYSQNFNALFYNKAIFDKFGVSYPKAGMTWQDAVGLARTLTRNDGGVQYRGLEVEGVSRFVLQRSLNFIDATTNKANVNNDSMKQIMQLYTDIYTIPGNLPNHPVSNQALDTEDFIKNQNLAMYATTNHFSQVAGAKGLDWGVVQYPSFPDQPNTYGMPDEHVNVLSAQSKHKDDAVKVIELLASADVQKNMASRSGQFTVLKDPAIVNAFGQEMPELKNKIDPSVFKSSPAPSKPFSDIYGPAKNAFEAEAYKMLTSGSDINTVLRTAEEKINQLLAAQK